MKKYRTSEVAKIIGVHSNTILAYEKSGYVSKVKRSTSGYRIYTDNHIEQIKLVRLVLTNELIKTYMWFKVRDILKIIGKEDLNSAFILCKEFLSDVQREKLNEYRVIEDIKRIVKEHIEKAEKFSLHRSEVAKLIDVSIDIIINWERNGILSVPRNNKNNYRVYSEKEILILKVTKLLRKENYCTQCVRGMIKTLENNDFNFINKENKLLSKIEEKEEGLKRLMFKLYELINDGVFKKEEE
ncbi:MerR family transcriptional regulator [Clostridium sp. AL.422]|uniref:MerR family transcriptional regulator n=1 Tax=Clostridium TaxID=1485 RepID=UPI00293DB6F3|nr:MULTISPECIES: MerR family transcriptional regulator [unclassified Clostridium]MDV4149302.1 MerR family transcriptional regulator [Clostridium sp. AL.422]